MFYNAKKFSVITVLMIVLATQSVPSNAKDNLPGQTEPLSTDELWQIYHNRTWQWTDGAGFFANKGRNFTAYSARGRNANFAEGTWFIPREGRVCFRADWVGVYGSVPKTTCFDHRKDGRNVYQRRLPSGKWYVFKHTPLKNWDEFRKLLPRDYVSSGLERNRRAIKRHQ